MKKDNIFWIGYSDLMSSLFFVMLILFVLTVGFLKLQQKKLTTTIEKQKKLLQIEEQFKPLEKSGNFIYLPNCKKYIAKDLMGKEIFDPNKSAIKEKYVSIAVNIGYEIERFLRKLNNDNPDLSYLLVIEGNMANRYDKSISKNNKYGYLKSYERALSVYNLWLNKGISLRKYNTEIMLCGSGFNGLCRDNVEENNKRFSIQIIPKVQNRINK